MKSIPLLSFLLFSSFAQAADQDSGWIRLIGHDKSLLLRPDGTERTEAVSNPTSLLFRGQVSPDGAAIVCVNDRAIYLADNDGKNPRRISPENVIADVPSWSPDGRRIAFAGTRGEHWQVHLMDKDGANLRQLTDDPHGAWLPKFGPDGRLAYLSYAARLGKLQPANLIVCDVRDAKPRDIKTIANNLYIVNYAWSPDGKTIAYSKVGSLVFHELATGARREVNFATINNQMTSHAAFEIAWHPDSQAVACSIMFLGDRREGGPKIFGDDELFILPRTGQPTRFQPGIKFEHIEWVKSKDAGK
jgi:tricorn protease-like protein